MRSMLSTTLRNGKVACGVRSGVICLSTSKRPRAPRRAKRRRAIAKAIISTANRTLVNMGMRIGKGPATNAVASFRNGCSLSIPKGNRVIFSCVNCHSRALGPSNGGMLGMAVRRSARRVNRIIMATLKVGHRGGVLNCTIRRLGDSRLGGANSPSMADTLRNGITNLRVGASTANLNNSAGVAVHKGSSLASGGRPL